METDKYEKIWDYLGENFKGQDVYRCIGFLETFKQSLLDEIDNEEEED